MAPTPELEPDIEETIEAPKSSRSTRGRRASGVATVFEPENEIMETAEASKSSRPTRGRRVSDVATVPEPEIEPVVVEKAEAPTKSRSTRSKMGSGVAPALEQDIEVETVEAPTKSRSTRSKKALGPDAEAEITEKKEELKKTRSTRSAKASDLNPVLEPESEVEVEPTKTRSTRSKKPTDINAVLDSVSASVTGSKSLFAVSTDSPATTSKIRGKRATFEDNIHTPSKKARSLRNKKSSELLTPVPVDAIKPHFEVVIETPKRKLQGYEILPDVQLESTIQRSSRKNMKFELEPEAENLGTNEDVPGTSTRKSGRNQSTQLAPVETHESAIKKRSSRSRKELVLEPVSKLASEDSTITSSAMKQTRVSGRIVPELDHRPQASAKKARTPRGKTARHETVDLELEPKTAGLNQNLLQEEPALRGSNLRSTRTTKAPNTDVVSQPIIKATRGYKARELLDPLPEDTVLRKSQSKKVADSQLRAELVADNDSEGSIPTQFTRKPRGTGRHVEFQSDKDESSSTTKNKRGKKPAESESGLVPVTPTNHPLNISETIPATPKPSSSAATPVQTNPEVETAPLQKLDMATSTQDLFVNNAIMGGSITDAHSPQVDNDAKVMVHSVSFFSKLRDLDGDPKICIHSHRAKKHLTTSLWIPFRLAQLDTVLFSMANRLRQAQSTLLLPKNTWDRLQLNIKSSMSLARELNTLIKLQCPIKNLKPELMVKDPTPRLLLVWELQKRPSPKILLNHLR